MEKLLKSLINDEKKSAGKLYSAGSYWDYKNLKTIHQIKKNGISNFRGYNTGVGTSFTDNLIIDIRNELNFKGRLAASLFSLPIIKKIFISQLHLTKNLMDKYVDILSSLYEKNPKTKELIEKYKFEKTTEFECVQKINFEGKEISINYLEMANRINNFSNIFKFNNISSFFEIGGGFGSNVHFIITNFPNIKKVIYLDIVPNIYIGTEYLRYFYKKQVIDYSNLKDVDKIKFSDNNELEILCIPPWLIERLDVQIDHFHNASSFVEMPEEIISNYCTYIKKFNAKNISLISYDYFDPKTTINPEKLNSHFQNKLKVKYLPTLIGNKKELYFSSK